MMNTLSEILKDVKDRLTSPFFSSFLVSWFVLNWKIPIVLFFYKYDELLKAHTTYIDFILRNSNSGTAFIYPLIAALVYTFLYPAFRNAIIAAANFHRTWGEKLVHKITNDDRIPLAIFLEQKKNTDELSRSLTETITTQGAFREENNKLRGVIKQNEQEFATYKLEVSKSQEAQKLLSSSKRIEGVWESTNQEIGITYGLKWRQVKIAWNTLSFSKGDLTTQNLGIRHVYGDDDYIILIISFLGSEEKETFITWTINFKKKREFIC